MPAENGATEENLNPAAAQSAAGRELLLRHDFEPDTVPTLAVVTGGQASARSAAALAIAGHLRPPWRWLGVFRVVPRPARDWLYDIVARHRYRWFGRRDSCLLPTPELAARFLDHPSSRPRSP